MYGKGPDPCAYGAAIRDCPSCSQLTDEQWVHLESTFHFRSDKREKKARRKSGSSDQVVEEVVDESILDLEPGEEESVQPDLAGLASAR